jgi:hypothetical protein
VNERPTGTDDERDAAVDRAWREQSHEQPSASVDDFIRAAARREIDSRPGAGTASARPVRLPQRRWISLAAAASLGVLAFGLLRWIPQQNDVVPPLKPRDQTIPDTQPAPPPGLPHASATAPSPAGGADDRSDQQFETAPPAPAVGPRAAETSPMPSLDDVPSPVVAAPAVTAQPPSAKGAATAAKTETSQTPATARTAAEADTVQITSAREPASWVRDIAAAHETGDLARAAELLREFRSRFTDADDRLPEDLREWAATIAD